MKGLPALALALASAALALSLAACQDPSQAYTPVDQLPSPNDPVTAREDATSTSETPPPTLEALPEPVDPDVPPPVDPNVPPIDETQQPPPPVDAPMVSDVPDPES